MHADEAIARAASRQGGNVTTEQLRDAGLGRGAIAWRVRNGRLHHRHRGVFLVGHEAEPPNSREWAAQLACGRGAVVSHRSAGGVFELFAVHPAAVIDVTIPSRSRRQVEGVRVHRAPSLQSSDVGEWDGLPITSPARTLLDLAGRLGPRDLERAVSEALVQRLVARPELESVLARHRGHGGAAILRALLDGDPKLTHKGVEELLLAKLRKARIREPETNQPLHPWTVDFLWRDARLVVETDSARFHGVPSAVERDRRKEADLRARGYTVLRYTWNLVANEIEFVIAEIAAALA